MLYYEKTAYPKIFKYSYWGSFNAIKDKPDKGTVENRNAFVKDLQIVSHWKSGGVIQKHRTEMDHQEFYEDKWGRMVQVYSEYPRTHYMRFIPQFTPMKPIYALDQESGYRIVETRKSKNILEKKVFHKLPDELVKYIKGYLIKGKPLRKGRFRL
jgi:hypothetical protein